MGTREGISLTTHSQDLVPRISAYTGYLIDALCSSSPCFVTSTGLHAFSGGFTQWEVLAGERYQKMSLLTHSLLHSTGQLRLLQSPPFLLGDVPHIVSSPCFGNHFLSLVKLPIIIRLRALYSPLLASSTLVTTL